jgi:hypothetical protein
MLIAAPINDRVVKCLEAAKESSTWPTRARACLEPTRPPLFYDVFSGPNCPMSVAFSKLGWAVRSVDTLMEGADHNLTSDTVLQSEKRWISSHRPEAACLGPPCSTFATFVSLCWQSTRTKEKPWGQDVRTKERLGN